ncbi:MAG: trans-aconitate 2-methyltransferase [Actinomycetota bacterium]|nr:trans-aconitate 2-methyltransferase [Actinomycetota bacterium]
MTASNRSKYAFGDSDIARERMAIVAGTFATPTCRLLDELPPMQPRYVIDMGCGPGHATALLRQRFPHSEVTGLDESAAMVDEARGRVPGAWFTVADVSDTLRLPADVVYARMLLGHLAEPAGALERWAAAIRPPGLIVCEEPVRYLSEDPLFTRYEAAVTAVVAARGATLWAGPVLDNDPPGCERILDRVVEHPVRAGRAAAMFWRNAVTWGDEVDDSETLIARLRTLEADDPDDDVRWEIRQTVWSRTAR